MSSFEARVTRIEKNTQEDIKLNVQSLKGDIIDSIKSDVNKLVDNRNKTLEDRRRRDHNVVFFNLPEHNSSMVTENKTKDESDVNNTASHLGLDNISITTAYYNISITTAYS